MDDSLNLSALLATARGVLRRRWLWLVAPMLIGVPLAIGVAALLPPVYVSTARILVESQVIPDDLARSTVGQSAGERIQFIQQRLLTRQNLLGIAAQYAVFGAQPAMSSAEIVDRMREATRIEGTDVGAARRGPAQVTGVSISFRADNPVTAARVANEFVSRVIAENVQTRAQRATGTLAFFDQEVSRLAAELDAQSAEIARFKSANQFALPETLTTRQSELVALRERVFQMDIERAALARQQEELRQALDIGGEVAGMETSPLGQEIQRLRNTLAQQKATLADTHPTIRQLNARLAALEGQTGVMSDAGGAPTGVGGRAAELLSRIETIQTRLDQLTDRIENDTARIAGLTDSIERTPTTEMALASLQRRYETTQARHREAILKRAQAEMGERLEASQQAERFEVIEQAIAAERPESPNRPLIIAGGVFGSGALGFGLMVLVELLNRVLRSGRDVEAQLGIRAIVTIPYIRSDDEKRRRRWTRVALALAALVGAPAALFAVDQLYLPLPVLVQRLLETLGLNGLIGLAGART